jgi:hypothetical protein
MAPKKTKKRISITIDVDETWTRKDADKLANSLFNKVHNDYMGLEEITVEVGDR